MAKKLTDVVTDARDAGTPLVAVATADQIAAMAAICEATNGAAKVAWDAARGVRGINPAGQAFVKSCGAPEEIAQNSTNPQTALEIADKLPEDGIFFMVSAHRFVEDAFVSTGLLNKREPFKANGRTMLLLGPAFNLPAELRQDVVVLEDPLPDDPALETIVEKLAGAAGLAEPKDKVQRAVDAVRGLSPFAAEQVLAMSLRKSGVDLESLWDRKRAQIAQTKGVTLLKGGPTFADIGGNAAICEFGRRLMTGPRPPRAIWIIDEIEKYMAGAAGGDASGVTADFLGVMLREMEDGGHGGIILVSPPGCGKTLFAKALAVEYGRPAVAFDFGAAKGRYVGDSEGNVRAMFKVGNAVAAGEALVVATCNRLEALPPELRRRFKYGIWYFDLPDRGEREAIWKVQTKAHGLEIELQPLGVSGDEGWTGAEIRNCCEIASRLGCSLKEAASFVVPVIQADPKSVESLRTLADGRFLSANHPGTYSRAEQVMTDTRRVRAVES